MKRLVLFIMAGITAFFVMKCQQEKTPIIGLLMDSYVQERWEKDKNYFVERVNELGGKVLVEVANGNEKKQTEDAIKMLEQGVKVLVVVAVNREAASKIVELAHNKDVKVIAYDRLIRKANLDYYISFDNIEVGELQADYLTKRKPSGNYGIIGGPPTDNNSFLFKLGQMNILQPLIEKGDIKIVYDNHVDAWLEEEGSKKMEECLTKTGGEIDAVLVANDALAAGAIKILEKHGLAGKVLVSGMDAETDACKHIIAGTQTMSVYKPIRAIATTAAEAAFKLAKNEKLVNANLRVNNGKKMVPSILLSSMVVNRDNIKMTVIEDKFQEEEDIFQ